MSQKPIETVVTHMQDDIPVGTGLGIHGTWNIDIERKTPGHPNFGTRERYVYKNLVTTAGMNFLAQYVSSWAIGTNSLMAYIAVGTSTTAASINQTLVLGEVKRLAFSAVSVGANSWSAVTTFGGGTDSIVGVVVGEAAVLNRVESGYGVMFNRAVLGSTFTLQSSDIAAVQVIVAVGSR